MADLTDSETRAETRPEVQVIDDDPGLAKVSVALSGGGHRASLFGLGALQYLADAGTNRQVTSIASVSGGSLTNAYVGQNCAYREVDGPGFQAAVTDPFVRQLSTRGSLFAPLRTKLYIVALVVGLLVALVAPWFITGVGFGWRLAMVIGGLVSIVALAWLRGRICRSAFRDELFSPGASPTKLVDMHEGVDHVICATDLQSGDHLYFARDIVSGYQFGLGTPGDVDLADAAGASAALPGGFPPVSIPTAKFGFTNGKGGKDATHVRLVDGGVYDNMGDQWGVGYSARKGRLPECYRERVPDELIVVNASSGATWTRSPWVHVPVIGEVMALRRDQSIQYDNTTSHRRRALIDRFDRARDTGKGTTGAYIGIDQSPHVVPDKLKEHKMHGARAKAASQALERGPTSAEDWRAVAEASDSMSTHLNRLDPAEASDVVWHAYVVTMINLHVLLDYPLLAIPNRDRFRFG